MSTFSQLRTRIADKLNRSDLNSQINESINAAIEFYAAYRFWFSETTGTFSTIASQEAYGIADGIPSTIAEIDYLKITISSTDQPDIEKRPIQWIQERNEGRSTGTPSYYAWYQNKIYFSLIPDAIKTITVFYKKSYAELSADSDTNDFTTYARKLIESHALMLVYEEVLKIPEQALIHEKRAANELQSLIIQTENFTSSNQITPTQW